MRAGASETEDGAAGPGIAVLRRYTAEAHEPSGASGARVVRRGDRRDGPPEGA
jgi:hypothetical protein